MRSQHQINIIEGKMYVFCFISFLEFYLLTFSVANYYFILNLTSYYIIFILHQFVFQKEISLRLRQY